MNTEGGIAGRTGHAKSLRLRSIFNRDQLTMICVLKRNILLAIDGLISAVNCRAK